MLSQDKYPVYILYASGEILLVVIGILLALQIDNWAENRRLEKLEDTVLKEIRSEVTANIISLERNINWKQDVLDASRLIFERTGPDAVWDPGMDFDSVLFKVIFSGFKFFPESGVVTDILSTGKLSIIQNDSLRYMISSLPADITKMSDEDDTYRMDLHGYILPFLSGYYPIRYTINERQWFTRDLSSGTSRYKNDPETLLRNQELEGILTIQTIWISSGLWMYDLQLDKYRTILRLIDQELDKSK